MFGDLTSAAGLKKLNDFLLDKSYIKGFANLVYLCIFKTLKNNFLHVFSTMIENKKTFYRTQPTQADVTVFTDIKKVPSADLVNCLRWYNHIKSYGDEKKKYGLFS